MAHNGKNTGQGIWGKYGFTLLEAVIVIALIAIISAIAVPLSLQWAQNNEYRASARKILYVLREAKSSAIASNLEHRVEFENENRRYRVTRGNRSNNSIDWSTVIYDWTVLPPGVHLSTNVDLIQVNTNGTANGGTISIKDETNRIRYEVRIARTGRIRMPTVF